RRQLAKGEAIQPVTRGRGSLGSIVGFVSPADAERELWAVALALLDSLRPYSLRGTARCRKRRRAPSVQVHRAADSAAVGLVGVVTCASPHWCPVCALRICINRAAEVTQAVERWAGPIESRKSGAVSMLTLTTRHALGNNLREARSTLAEAHRT